MHLGKYPVTLKTVGAVVALSVISAPVVVLADASNPIFMPKPKKKAKAKPKAVKAAPRKAVVKPVAQPAPPAEPAAPAPSYTPPQQPVYTPPPPPAPAPAPVYTPPPAPPPVSTIPVAKGGHGLLYGLLGAAAVIAGIAVATGGSDSPTSP